MLKITKPKEAFLAYLLVLVYSCLSLVYFAAVDQRFAVRNVLNCNIAFVFPLPYLTLVALFIGTYSYIFRQKARDILYPTIAMAVILPLFYLLTDMKIGIRVVDPLGGNRSIYGAYAAVYYFAAISLFSILSGRILNGLVRGEMPGIFKGEDPETQDLIFHLPVFIWFGYVVTVLFSSGFTAYAIYAVAAFLTVFLSERVLMAVRTGANVLASFVKNERLFLITLFVIAFVIRYFWGVRILDLLGARQVSFLLASDDGRAYDSFATLIAQGRLIPKENIYAMSGFGYWYFLSAIYKVFGPHNFKAVIIIQSLIGASVPVLAYLVCKNTLRSCLAAVLAGVVASIDMTLVFLSVVVGMEAIYIPLVLIALLVTIRLLGRGAIDGKSALTIGLVFGLAYNARPPELLLFPFVLAFMVFVLMRKQMSVTKRAVAAASIVAGFIILAGIQYATNYITYGKHSPRLQGAVVASFHEGVADGAHTDENKILGRMGFSPFEDLNRSVSVLKRQPSVVLGLIAKGFLKRFFILCFIPNFGVFDAAYLVNPASGYFFRYPVYLQCCGYLLVVVGMIAAFFRKEADRMAVVALGVFFVYISLRIAFFYVLNCRYRGTLLPIFIISFAYGVAFLTERVRGSYKKREA